VTGYLKRETPGWGVMDEDGAWLAYHVEEAEARRVFAEDQNAWVLASDIDSNEISGDEDFEVVAVKPAICVECGVKGKQAWEGCLVMPEGWDYDKRGTVCPAHVLPTEATQAPKA